MAVKTITIDTEAYRILLVHKAPGQSFSDVIKVHFGRVPTAARFRALARGLRVSADALNGMERLIRERRAEPAKSARR